GVKRWGVLALLGVALIIFGAALAFAYVAVDFSLAVMELSDRITGRLPDSIALGIMCLLFGVAAVAVGWRGVYKAVVRVYSSETRADFLETALKRRRLDSGERIVAIGGGTGLSTMLRGLKHYSSNITAIVTMADDGGSSGMLREHGMLPPGDLRNCIAALAEAEPLMTQLFQHRFEGLGELKGHSLGNLIVAAMFEITGDFDQAVRETSKVLAIRGRVLPSTLEDVRLGAELEDGTHIEGQVNVNKAEKIAAVSLLPPNPKALPGVVQAIQEAEMIVIGPGSLFTSIIPNLLVPEIAAAIKASKAPKIYVCNVMTQPNETLDYSAADHVRALIRHIGQGVITHVLLNSGKVPDEVLARYSAKGAKYIQPEETEIEMLGVRPIHGPFIDVSNVVRHNSHKLAAAIFRIAARL
ncbi:MAG TPA: gluconeogenesis factor YvcK family protein, partial [Abditibacterium sp.]